MLEHLPDSIPFIAASTAAGAPRNWSVQRIAEALIIAGMTAAATTYVTVAVLDERVKGINARIDRIEQDADRRVGALQEDVRRIYSLLVENRPPRRTER